MRYLLARSLGQGCTCRGRVCTRRQSSGEPSYHDSTCPQGQHRATPALPCPALPAAWVRVGDC